MCVNVVGKPGIESVGVRYEASRIIVELDISVKTLGVLFGVRSESEFEIINFGIVFNSGHFNGLDGIIFSFDVGGGFFGGGIITKVDIIPLSFEGIEW